MKFPLNKFTSLATPFYYYDLSLLEANLVALKQAVNPEYVVHYALKANANNRILEVIKNNGIGADCVSGNEVRKAVEVGFNSSEIAFRIVRPLSNSHLCFLNIYHIPFLS